MNLSALYDRAIAHSREFETDAEIVHPSIPILYFGDLARYEESAMRIVTVGLNPSDAEFREARFPDAHGLQWSAEKLESALSNYFRFNPYTTWFNRSFERLLQPLGASYYGRDYPQNKVQPAWWEPRMNVALHTDICTPLATSPTWSGLPSRLQARLQRDGFDLWRDLVVALKPHLILISVAKRHLSLLGDLRWRSFYPFEPHEDRHEMSVARLSDSSIVWGRPQRTPFFHIRHNQLVPTASAILRNAGIR